MRYVLALILSVFLLSCGPESKCFSENFVADLPGALFAHTMPINDIEKDQLDMFNKMRVDFPNIDVKLLWEPCFQENAFYSTREHEIHMCEEIEDLGQGSVMALAHEFGHAITHQVTDTLSESDADEIGALEMLKYHKHQGIIDQVTWFVKMDMTHIEGDPHPSSFYRAWELACLELGSREEFGKCPAFYEATKIKWQMRLQLDSL